MGGRRGEGKGRWGARSTRARGRSLGAQLARARLALDKPLRALADELGVTLSTVERWESGKGLPRGLYRAALIAWFEKYGFRVRP